MSDDRKHTGKIKHRGKFTVDPYNEVRESEKRREQEKIAPPADNAPIDNGPAPTVDHHPV